MTYLWPKLWNTVTPEQKAITLPARANNNLNSLSTTFYLHLEDAAGCLLCTLLGKQLQRGLGNNCLIHRQ